MSNFYLHYLWICSTVISTCWLKIKIQKVKCSKRSGSVSCLFKIIRRFWERHARTQPDKVCHSKVLFFSHHFKAWWKRKKRTRWFHRSRCVQLQKQDRGVHVPLTRLRPSTPRDWGRDRSSGAATGSGRGSPASACSRAWCSPVPGRSLHAQTHTPKNCQDICIFSKSSLCTFKAVSSSSYLFHLSSLPYVWINILLAVIVKVREQKRFPEGAIKALSVLNWRPVKANVEPLLVPSSWPCCLFFARLRASFLSVSELTASYTVSATSCCQRSEMTRGKFLYRSWSLSSNWEQKGGVVCHNFYALGWYQYEDEKLHLMP